MCFSIEKATHAKPNQHKVWQVRLFFYANYAKTYRVIRQRSEDLKLIRIITIHCLVAIVLLTSREMQEPNLTIDGQVVQLGDDFTMDDYDIILEHSGEALDAIDTSGIPPIATTTSSNSSSTKNTEPTTPQKSNTTTLRPTDPINDNRGLPIIRFLGRLRPDYDNVDITMQRTLRIQMVASLGNLRSLHTDLTIMSDDKLYDLHLHDLHTYSESIQNVVNARASALFYTKALYAATMTVEKVAAQFGFKVADKFTEKSLVFASIFKGYAGRIAWQSEEQGTGLLSGISPAMQLGLMWTSSLGFYCLLNYFMGDRAEAAYDVLGAVMADSSSVMVEPPTPLVATDASIPPNTSPFATAVKPSGGGGIMDNLDKVGKYVDLASRLFGGNSSSAPTAQNTPSSRRQTAASVRDRPRAQRRRPTNHQ